MNKIKVLTVLNRLDLGGIEKTLLSALPLLKKDGVNIHVLSSCNGYLDEQYIRDGAVLHHFNRSRNPIYDAIFLFHLLKREKFDIVHSRDGHTSGLLSIACKIASVPIVVSVHNEKSNFKINWENSFILSKIRYLYLNLNRILTLHLSSLIIGHSKANLIYYEKYKNSNKYELIYNGVDFTKFERDYRFTNIQIEEFLKDVTKVFMHIGSFRAQKNHSFLLEVFAKLKPENNKYKLILIGAGHLQNDMKKKAKDLNIDQQVHFVGLDVNLKYYFDKSDVFIFPSLHEGFGNVLIEAQYNKLLIAASLIKPHLESVHSGYHQYLFDPNNVDDAVNKIHNLINDSQKKEFQLTKDAAFLFSTNFSIQAMASNLIKSYKKILKIEN